MDTYFIRVAGASEYRGEGTWTKIDPKNDQQVRYWAWCKETGHLPVGRTCAACDVRDNNGKRPTFVVVGDELMHQFAGFAVCVPTIRDPKVLQYHQNQLLSLVQQQTEVGHVTEEA